MLTGGRDCNGGQWFESGGREVLPLQRRKQHVENSVGGGSEEPGGEGFLPILKSW